MRLTKLIGPATAVLCMAAATAAQATGPGVLRATDDGRLILVPSESATAIAPAVADGSTPPAIDVAASGSWRDRSGAADQIDARAGALDPRVRLAAVIDISEQTMTVTLDGRVAHVWPVSTGRAGHWTPTGSFRPFWLSEHHRSSLYDDAPMPYSVFFNGNIAVHGTTYVSRLGSPASHGCIRVETANARTFFEMVEIRNYQQVSIRVVE